MKVPLNVAPKIASFELIKKNTPFSGFFQLFGSDMLGKLLYILAYPVLLRFFPPSAMGQYALFQTIYGVTLIFFTFTDHACLRFGREEFSENQTFQKTFYGTLFIKLPMIFIICVGIITFRQEIMTYTGFKQAGVLHALLAISIGGAVSGNVYLLRAREQFTTVAVIGLLKLAPIIVMVVALSFLKVEVNAIWLVWMMTCILLLSYAFSFFMTMPSLGKPKTDPEWSRMMLVFSLPFLIHALGARTVDYIDTIVMRIYLDTTSIGIYAIAYKIRIVALVPLGIIHALLLPRIILLYKAQEWKKLNWFYDQIAVQIAFFMGLAVSLLILAFPFIDLILGKEYARVCSPLAILMAAFSWNVYIYMMLSMFHASKTIWPHVLANIIIAIVNLGLDFILIPKIGIIGAAMATIVASWCGLIVHSIFFARLFAINPVRFVFLGFPVVMSSFLIACKYNYPGAVVLVLFSIFMALFMARKLSIFSAGSLAFFESLGLPSLIYRPFSVLYRSLLLKGN